MRKYLMFIFVIMLIIPFTVSAEEIEREVVAESTKYIKTTTIYNNSNVMRNAGYTDISSITTEITKEEFDSADTTSNDIAPAAIVDDVQTETTYKRLRTTIQTYGGYYRYEANLYWKNIPKVRSYDIMGIGHYADVELFDPEMIYFNQDYCRSTNNCYVSASRTEVIGTNGTGVVFKVPDNTLISLEQTLGFTVQKATSGTVYGHTAAGDYAHATKSISSSTAANNVVINIMGVALYPSIEGYYDTTPAAIAEWDCVW